MARVEFTCSDLFKKQIEAEAKKRGLTVASYVKATISDRMIRENKEG